MDNNKNNVAKPYTHKDLEDWVAEITSDEFTTWLGGVEDRNPTIAELVTRALLAQTALLNDLVGHEEEPTATITDADVVCKKEND